MQPDLLCADNTELKHPIEAHAKGRKKTLWHTAVKNLMHSNTTHIIMLCLHKATRLLGTSVTDQASLTMQPHSSAA